MNMIYRLKKSGSLYRVICRATDCTNARHGTDVVVYARESDSAVFTRDADEFREKFEPVGGDDVIAEVRSVLKQLDSIAELWGDEVLPRACLDRLRAVLNASA
jgi:hypothetical protein